MTEQLVTHETAIDRAILGVGPRARMCRRRAVAGNPQDARAGVDGARFGEKVVAENGASTRARVASGQMQVDTPVVGEGEGDFGMRQRDTLDRVQAMREFRAF